MRFDLLVEQSSRVWCAEVCITSMGSAAWLSIAIQLVNRVLTFLQTAVRRCAGLQLLCIEMADVPHGVCVCPESCVFRGQVQQLIG